MCSVTFLHSRNVHRLRFDKKINSVNCFPYLLKHLFFAGILGDQTNVVGVVVVVIAVVVVLVVVLLATYTYKYNGSSRMQGFRTWSYNLWGKCVTSKCICICCPDGDPER